MTRRLEAPAEWAGDGYPEDRMSEGMPVCGECGGWGDHLSTCARGGFRARSSAPEAREGEAVAWRCSRDHASDGNGQWFYYDGPPRPSTLARNVQPLYTHPAPPSADKLRIAVEAIWEIAGGRATDGHNEAGRLGRIKDRAAEVLATLKAEDMRND